MSKEEFSFIQKYHNFLIPVLALLVIFQAIALTTSLPKRTQVPTEAIPLSEVKTVPGTSAQLHFVPSGVSLKKNETVSVDLFLTPKRSLRLDGVDVILSFNPEVIQMVQVTTPKLFSFVSQKKEKENEGKIYLTFLEEKLGGLLISQQVKLLTLSIKGKALGESELAILVADEGPTTVITESGTSKKLKFDQGDLKLIVR